jgi:hypothetical protein
VTQDGDPEDLAKHVRAAYALLCDANKRAIQVPADVVAVITEARKGNARDFSSDFEAKFWNAYGLLSSSIRPAERARRFYRNVFYVVLAFLLLFQFFYLAGDYVRTKMADLDKQVIDTRGKSASVDKNVQTAISPAAADEQIKQIKAAQEAYSRLSGTLLQIAGAIADLPLRPFGFHSFFSVDTNGEDAGNIIMRGKLEMMLVFLSGYLLPMLYGLLGACAFVLRKLSDEIDKLTYAHDARVRYSLRLNIGLLSGLAVGWFIKSSPGDPTLVSLSPLALAFVAGYGSDLFFVALDKIVQAFAPSSGVVSRTTTEITSGGITQTTSRVEEARVAGSVSAAAGSANDKVGETRASGQKTEVTEPLSTASKAA